MVLKLLDWVLNFTTLNLFVEKRNYQEEHRIQWTTYNNLKCWLYNWEEDLVTIGFAEVQNEKIIANDQLIRIANIDKTCLALDGGTGQRGGWPSIVYIGKHLTEVCKAFYRAI